MQSVNILGDDGGKLALRFESSDQMVGRGRLGAMNIGQRLQRGAIERRRIAAKSARRHQLHQFLILPQSALAAEIWNAGFGADAGAGERDDAVRITDEGAGLFEGCIHSSPPPYNVLPLVSGDFDNVSERVKIPALLNQNPCAGRSSFVSATIDNSPEVAIHFNACSPWNSIW